MTSPLPLLRSFSTENQNRDWCKRFSLRVNRKATAADGKLVSELPPMQCTARGKVEAHYGELHSRSRSRGLMGRTGAVARIRFYVGYFVGLDSNWV